MPHAPPHVQVLLSTFNGERYLPALLESVFAQVGVQVSVLARDDGSADGTPSILRRYAATHPLTPCPGDNVGVTRSFFWLLQHASPEADLTALADQDDVWLEGKLARATALLPRDSAAPAMYCSQLTLVDQNLRVVGRSEPAPRGPSFANSLVQNIASGCTIVLNRAARALVAREVPRAAAMHDWWVYQAVAGAGRVVYDDESHILYRQHGANVVGGASSTLGGIALRLRHRRRHGVRRDPTAQLRELERVHGASFPPPHRALLRRHIAARATLARRLRFSLGPGIVFQRGWQEVAFRCLLPLNLA